MAPFDEMSHLLGDDTPLGDEMLHLDLIFELLYFILEASLGS
jgi:hypothetical protein